MLEYIAERVKNTSDAIYNIIAVPGASQQLSVIPLDAQASAYPASLPYNSYYPGYSQPAGGKFYDDLDDYAPETIIDHYSARAQIKKTDSQSIELRKIINRNNSYTIGRGLRLKSTPDHEILGITLEEATIWAKNTGNRYHLWSKSKDSDVTGINNKYQNQRFAWRQRKLLGEAFPRFFYSDDPKLMNPLQIGFIDPNQIRGDELTFSSGPESQDDGINKDTNGKPISAKAWVVDHEKPGRYKDVTIPFFDEKTGLPILLHMYEPKSAGQSRGITEFLPAISDLEKITGFKTAALDREKNGSAPSYVVENMQADPSDMELNALNTTSAGTLTKTTTGATIDEDALPWTYTGIGGGMLTTGMVISGGRQGDVLKPSPDLSTKESSKDFVGSISESIAAMGNMSPETVDMKVNTSFTAAKGAFGLQDIETGIERDDLESDFEDMIYFAWLSGEIAAGRTQAPGWSDPIMRAAWLKKRLVGDPSIILNPAQESAAAEKNVAMGRIDLGENAENFNGSDYEINAANLKKQIAILPTNSPIIKPAEDEPLDDDNENKNGDD